ncbi:MAG: cellulose biosynthesis cyclic di-GMP-binding regulatory protein BcsB [Chloroflexota bacterium]
MLKKLLSTNLSRLAPASSMIGATAITSGLGVVYWWVANRFMLPASVGLASAAIGVTMLLSTICLLGTDTWLTGEIPKTKSGRAKMVSSAAIFVTAVSFTAGAFIALISGLGETDLQPLGEAWFWLGIGVAANTLFFMSEAVLIALLRGDLQLVNNSVFAVSKLLILIPIAWLMSEADWLWIYNTWTIGNFFSLVLLVFLAFRRGVRFGDLAPEMSRLKRAWGTIGGHYIINIALSSPGFAMPVVVTLLIGVEVNAAFYVAWMLANFVFLVPHALTLVLYSVASDSEKAGVYGDRARLTIGLSLLAGTAAMVFFYFTGGLLLSVFNPTYDEIARSALLILISAVFPLTITNHYITAARLQNQIPQAAWFAAIGALFSVIGAVIGGYYADLEGLCLGLIIGMTIQALLVLPTVLRSLKGESVRLAIPVLRIFMALVVVLPLWQATTVQAQDDDNEGGGDYLVDTNLANMRYGGLQFQGIYGQGEVWLPYSASWDEINDIQVTITYVASPLLDADQSVVYVGANNNAVHSWNPIADGFEHRETFNVPRDSITRPGVLLDFATVLRVDDNICQDGSNPALWLRIEDQTNIRIDAVEDMDFPELREINGALFSNLYREEPGSIMMIIPDNPDDAILTEAVRFVSTLSRNNSRFDLIVETASTVRESDLNDTHIVLFGLTEGLPLLEDIGDDLPLAFVEGEFEVPGNIEPVEDYGLVQTVRSPFNSDFAMLVLAAGDSTGLSRATQLLENEGALTYLGGNSVYLANDVVLPPSTEATMWLENRATFSELGRRDVTIQGYGVFDTIFNLTYPPGWELEDNAQLVLRLAGSPTLTEDQSYVDVFVDDVFVGTIETGSLENEHTESFELPAAVINNPEDPARRDNQLTVRLSVANTGVRASCEYPDPRLLWTTIFSDSYVVLPHTFAAVPDLQVFPYPFVSSGNRQANTAIVVSPNPTPRDIGTALQLGMALGNYLTDQTDLIVTTADTTEDLSGRHLILIGERDEHPLIEAALSNEEPNSLVELYRSTGNTELGFLHLLQADNGLATLMVYADDTAGVENAVTSLARSLPITPEQGSIAVVDDTGSVTVLFRDEMNEIAPAEDTEASDASASAIGAPARSDGGGGGGSAVSDFLLSGRSFTSISDWLMVLSMAGIFVGVSTLLTYVQVRRRASAI